MDDSKRDEMLIDMHAKLSQVHDRIYKNGLLSKVERHEEILRDGHLTCPIRELTERAVADIDVHVSSEQAAKSDRAKENRAVREGRRYAVPLWLFLVLALAALGAPFVERVLFK